jgi:glucose/arabinose dehydrogenase
MAFDPNFVSSGEVYFAYTRSGTSVLVRWVSGDNGRTFAPDTPLVVLAMRHPFANHNAGDIMFGSDRLLYYSMGDGGGNDDPEDNGQDPNVLLGKILRIDVNAAPPVGEAYAIPASNPNSANPHCDGGTGAAPCPEIFAFGLRNPWRMNFDPAPGGVLYVGDVGEARREEIDIIVSDGNYGWNCFEGDLTFDNVGACIGDTFIEPEVVHNRTDAQAITGGAVYRGSAIPGLVGFYVYGDFLTQLFFAFDVRVPDAPVQRLTLPLTSVSAFGQGRDGEIYVLSFGSPSIQKIVPAP